MPQSGTTAYLGADYDVSHLPAFQLDKYFARLMHMVMCWGDATPYLYEILCNFEDLINSVDFGTLDTLLTRQKRTRRLGYFK